MRRQNMGIVLFLGATLIGAAVFASIALAGVIGLIIKEGIWILGRKGCVR